MPESAKIFNKYRVLVFMERVRNLSMPVVYRSVMIAALLLGLVISSGEGVRLFPIPNDPTLGSTGNKAPEAQGSSSERYSIGVLQARSLSQFKHKNSKRPAPDLSAVMRHEAGSTLLTFYHLISDQTTFAPIDRSLPVGLQTPSDRAPPLA
jgi:hypothetical protein